MKLKQKTSSDVGFDIISTIIFVLAIIVCIVPFIWMILNSFKTHNEIFLNPLGIPENFDFSVFPQVWQRLSYSAVVPNSIIVTVGSVVLVLITAAPAAFALARLKFRGSTFFSRMFTSSIIISAPIIIIPLFYIVLNLGLYNNIASVILAHSALALPVSIILFTGFFREIPKEIEESAKMDGCSNFRFFFSFVLPLSKPIIATNVIFQSLWAWNDYLYSLTFLKKEAVRTMPLQLQQFFSQYSTDWTQLFAALTMSIIPLLVLYLILQKYFIKGLTSGAVKM